MEPAEHMNPLLQPVKRRMDASRDVPAFRRDAGFVRRALPMLEATLRWFDPEVRGIEHIPTEGPALVVGNHCGATAMPDANALLAAVVHRRGFEQPVYSLAYDLMFAVPGLEAMLRRFGVLPANPANAEAALREGAAVLVYPGGDWEACRPWTERHRVEFHDHHGFVRVALRAGVPVVPVVAHGSHESMMIVTRGDRFARAVGLDRIRINVFPVALGFPFGITPMFLPVMPLPTKVVVEVLPPLDWSRWYGRDDDPDVVHRCYLEVVGALQHELDRLASEEPHALLGRFHVPRWSRRHAAA